MVKYYAVRHKDRNILKKSRSGGFFTLISDFVLERNGVVYACKLNEELKVTHTRAATKQREITVEVQNMFRVKLARLLSRQKMI